MTTIEAFEGGTLSPGGSKEFVLHGAGPFRVTTQCFVDDPPPPGFRSCPECSSFEVAEDVSFRVECPEQLWERGQGHMLLDVVDAHGERARFRLNVEMRGHDDDNRRQIVPA